MTKKLMKLLLEFYISAAVRIRAIARHRAAAAISFSPIEVCLQRSSSFQAVLKVLALLDDRLQLRFRENADILILLQFLDALLEQEMDSISHSDTQSKIRVPKEPGCLWASQALGLA